MQSNDFRRGRHCVFMMHVHLVFVTKYRRARFSADQLGLLKGIFESVCKDFNAELVEMNGERDHVHLLVNYPPNVSVSKLVNSLKGVSSRLLRKQSPAGFERCFGSCLWSPSYFAASCGRSSALDYQDIHRESRDTWLVKNSRLISSALKDGALRRNWVNEEGVVGDLLLIALKAA